MRGFSPETAAGAVELEQMLVDFDLDGGTPRVRNTIAADLPIGPPRGVIPKPLRGIAPILGRLGAFAGIAGDSDGTAYLSADAEGSVMALRHS